ncbi:hypothetical protein BDZ91DRAFT_520796 [Kalaharituber pfeilii]|nr:hypothetical protein BDZ91DRAFT_520796 [Kalaharituber pfeilii]
MQAYHKSLKARSIKKGKAVLAKSRQEKLARRNPARIARQVEELKAHAATLPGGELRGHDKKVLEELERELEQVRRARKALGVEDEERKGGKGKDVPSRDGGSQRGGGTGSNRVRVEKRRWDGNESDSSTASSVREIPMPSGTPPPLPPPPPRAPHALPPKPEAPKVEAVTTYEAKPVVRDLRKEAAAFVPAAVLRRRALGGGGSGGAEGLGEGEMAGSASREGSVVAGGDGKGEEMVEEEYERFKREMGMDDDGNP